MTAVPIDTISKLDSSRRLTEEAIALFFENRDMLAVHALAAAAHQVLADLAIARGHQSILKNNPLLKPDRRAEWFQILNATHNFLKHADRDPDAKFEFRPGATPFFIMDSVYIYEQITKQRPHAFNVFMLWFNLKYPHLLLEGPIRQIIGGMLAQGMDPDDFEAIREVIRRGPNAIAT